MKNFIRLLASYALAILTMTIFVGCSEKIENVDAGPPYLSISSEKSLSEFTPEEWDILNEARSRMDITINSDKLMVIAQQSGSEVNISEHLFQKIKLMVDNGNRIISEACHPTTRMSGDDCVAFCIVEVSRRLGRSLDTQTVKRRIHEDCFSTGGNVPPSRVHEMINNFLVSQPISVPVSSAVLGMGEIIGVVLDLHAVIIDDIRGENLRVYDKDYIMNFPGDPDDGYAFVDAMYISQAIQASSVRN